MSNEKKNPKWNVVFWLSGIGIVVLLFVVGVFVYSYFAADMAYEKISDEAFDVASVVEDADADELAAMTVDWDYLRSVNADIVAWVYMPGTRINYPVVQGRTNDEYLHRDFSYSDGFTARGGAIFLDANNSSDMSDEINFVYGHHMNDGSMFACLSKQLSDQAEFDTHRFFYVLTPSKNYKCSTFSLYLASGDSTTEVRRDYSGEQDKEAFVSDVKNRSIVRVPADAPEPVDVSKLMMLATCDYTNYNGRAVLAGNVVLGVPPAAASEDAIRNETLTEPQVEVG